MEQSEHYIYYLNFSADISQRYVSMARELLNWNISLIPVSPYQLRKMATSKKQFVVSLNSSEVVDRRLATFRKNYLNSAMYRNIFTLFDVSAYPPIDDAKRLVERNCYCHIMLPAKVESICRTVAQVYYSDQPDDERWIGGRRAALPI